jgi:hypothetical protein
VSQGDIQQAVRELAGRGSELAARANTATAHPNYQDEKVYAAWRLLTRALLELGHPVGDLQEEIGRLERYVR